MHHLAKLDHRFLWHPFTQMQDWLRREPIVIVEGKGAFLRDAHGREYLDANASIWTNLHGHNHPVLNAAIRKQLGKIAHSSALGLANEPASRLAEQLVVAANPSRSRVECSATGLRNRSADLPSALSQDWILRGAENPEDATVRDGPADYKSAVQQITNLRYKENLRYEERSRDGVRSPASSLAKVFFSDDGSTAMEVALKLAYEYSRRTRRRKSPRFLSLGGAYHGDTIGAVSLGHIDLFHKAYRGLLFKSDQVPAPYCYRCPFNRAKPERADAREYRQCRWECLDKFEQRFVAQKKTGNPYAGFVFEPLIQGAAGMIPQPAGWLACATGIARGYGALLVADEVMTAFGRTGCGTGSSFARQEPRHGLFACHQEGVQPDFLSLAKGLTGGYLPMAATLTTKAVFDAFLGEYEEFKTFFHGHSYTGNQLGTAAALASLRVLQTPASIRTRLRLERTLREELKGLWSLPNVGDIRQVGLVAGIELVRDWRTREPFEMRERAGMRTCDSMARRGVLTRPIGNVIVLMPPYCTTPRQVRQMVTALQEAVLEARLGV
jgi:adenosylmethionine-8-amino-7-oxononanoate aminotransferase